MAVTHRGIPQGRGGQVHAHDRGRQALKPDPLGVFLVHPVQVASVVEDGECVHVAVIDEGHDQAGGRLHAAVVGGGKSHLELGAGPGLLDKVFADLFLELGVFDDNVFPGLGIGARAGVAARLNDLFENLPWNHLVLELPAGVPTPDDFQIPGIKIRRRSRGDVLSPLNRPAALSNQNPFTNYIRETGFPISTWTNPPPSPPLASCFRLE